ncbi:MAG: hypothetical protein ACTSV7_14310 [Candidatus Baldrarchaeia archaeon]
MEVSVRKLLEEAEEYLSKQNYSKAAYKYLEVAKIFEKGGKTKEAERYLKLAVDNFVIAANEARRVKSFRKAAENFLMALEVYEKLKMTEKRDQLVLNIASDLANAANEYLMWKEIRGAATCVAISSLIYFATGKIDDAKRIIESFKEKISAEDFEANRILNVASLVQKVVVDSDASTYSEVEGLVSSVLKPMLPLIKGNMFVKIIDEAMQTIGSKVKKEIRLPKITPALRVPLDLTFNTPFDVTLKLKNVGEGEAKNVKIIFNLPEEVEIVKGKREATIDMLPANGEVEIKITLNVPGKDVEKEEYDISADLEYFDMVGTAYSTTIGPVKITLHRVRESEKLKEEIRNAIRKMSDIKGKIRDFPEVLECVFLRLVDDVENIVNKSEDLLRKEKIDEVEINLKIADFVLNEISQILADKGLEEKVKLLKEQIKKAEKQENIVIRTSENQSEETGG